MSKVPYATLFRSVYQQTGGTGCYPDIAKAGSITQMKVIDSGIFPAGPLFVVRVTHTARVVADWFIGFNQNTGQIGYLSYQAAAKKRPTVKAGPDAKKNLGGVKPIEKKPDNSDDKRSPACQKFPTRRSSDLCTSRQVVRVATPTSRRQGQSHK